MCPAGTTSARELEGDSSEIKKNLNWYRRMCESVTDGETGETESGRKDED